MRGEYRPYRIHQQVVAGLTGGIGLNYGKYGIHLKIKTHTEEQELKPTKKHRMGGKTLRWARENLPSIYKWCVYCGSPTPKTIDHLIPRSKGGRSRPENLVLCCYDCNQRKGDMSVEDFVQIILREEEDAIRRRQNLLVTMRAM